MENLFFEKPILNSPYEYPLRHWELDAQGQPTQKIIEKRRRAEFITPIPKPKKRKAAAAQQNIVFDEGKGLSTQQQRYDPTPIINDLRYHVDKWRSIPNPNDWKVTPETARLLQHWRHHQFNTFRPFFCQIEAVETAIWLTEVAPGEKAGKAFLEHLVNANNDANPNLMRLALKLATGTGKTTVMAMLIIWQTINAVRRPNSKKFTHGFLVVTPGITIRDRLRVLPPDAIGEAVINAIAHRDYHSNASVEVRLFSDRLEIWNPGRLPGTLTLDDLRHDHPSVPNNPLIAESLYLTRYIEKAGSGTQRMIELCREAGLPEPQFEQRSGSFILTLWRDWLTDEVLKQLDINPRQLQGITYLKQNSFITSADFQKVVGCPPRTATRDLNELSQKGLIELEGKGRGARYRLMRKRAINKPNRPS